MDETDFRILAHLLAHPVESVEATAKSVRLTRNAVARRIQVLQRSPLQVRFWAWPHFTLFGRQSHVLLYQTSGEVDTEAILATDPVLGYDLNHDGLLATTIWTPVGEEPAPPASLDTLVGGPPINRYTDATPGPKHPFLSRLQWKVLRALIDAPRATTVELARRTGLAAKTCGKHRAELFTKRFLHPSASIQEDRSGGFPVYRVYVEGKPDRGAVRGVLGPDALVMDTVQEGHVYLAKAASMGAIIVNVDKLRRLPAVKDVKLILSRGFGVAVERLRAWSRDVEARQTPPS